MQPEKKGSDWDKVGKPIVIALSIILIFDSFLLIWIYINSRYMYPENGHYYYFVTGSLHMEYNNSTENYQLIVIYLDDEEKLKLNEVEISLLNANNTAFYDLPEVLDNEDKNITFHDIDKDGILTIGDEFIIDGEIVETPSTFRIIWKVINKSVAYYQFRE